jgi:dUTP pyrophosphatase
MYILRIFIVNESVRNYYTSQATSSPLTVTENAGFDLITPEDIPVVKHGTIDFGIRCEMRDSCNGENIAYWLIPRSSICKTPFRMSNSVGLIDAGYRGNILAAIDNISHDFVTIQKDQRLFQLVAPDLKPFQVEIVTELRPSKRGTGGFGSTGI